MRSRLWWPCAPKPLGNQESLGAKTTLSPADPSWRGSTIPTGWMCLNFIKKAAEKLSRPKADPHGSSKAVSLRAAGGWAPSWSSWVLLVPALAVGAMESREFPPHSLQGWDTEPGKRTVPGRLHTRANDDIPHVSFISN